MYSNTKKMLPALSACLPSASFTDVTISRSMTRLGCDSVFKILISRIVVLGNCSAHAGRRGSADRRRLPAKTAPHGGAANAPPQPHGAP
jgi:hypothetical protein